MKSDLILAPMMDICTPSFRKLIADEGGIGMFFTPMIFLNQITVAPKTIIPHLEAFEDCSPIAVQVVGSGKNEESLKESIDILNTFDHAILDINSGCPSRRTMNSGGGAALIRDAMEYHINPDSCDIIEKTQFQTLIEKIMKYSDKPVSVKTRLGYRDPREIFLLMEMYNDLGIEFLTVHGRTVSEKYSGTANYEIIKEIKETFEIPIVGNGDVRNYDSYKLMKQTGCDAIMIGRAAKSDPSLFNKINQSRICDEGDEPIPDFSQNLEISYIKNTLKKNIEYIETLSPFWNNERFKLAETRRLCIWMIKGIVGYKKVRMKLSKFGEFDEISNYIFNGTMEQDFTD